MPPCLDVYVRVPERNSEILGRFIHTYVNVAISDERLHAFMRVHILGIANDTDVKIINDVRLNDRDEAFTLYLRARDHHHAIITFTRDGATVLGLSIDAPDDLPETLRQAEQPAE
ncbi:hypothetical protein AB0392_12320 [Nonomuraea angiospora]|uniref:hypothetical protein n=1 Tax=Nonomuraea angiospora TaxID=46172 RepID=UPI00344CEE92